MKEEVKEIKRENKKKNKTWKKIFAFTRCEPTLNIAKLIVTKTKPKTLETQLFKTICFVTMVTNCLVAMVTGGRPGCPGDGSPGVDHGQQVDRRGDGGACTAQAQGQGHLLLGRAQNTGKNSFTPEIYYAIAIIITIRFKNVHPIEKHRNRMIDCRCELTVWRE